MLTVQLDTCNIDQTSFKGYLSRWMAKSAVLQPSINAAVAKYLSASARAVAQSCTGGNGSQACGQKWYTGGYDGIPGVGQQLAALETVQSLLLLEGSTTKTVPRTNANVRIQVVPNRSEFPLTPPRETSNPSSPETSSSGSGAKGSSAANANFLNRESLKLWLATVILLIAVAFSVGPP